LRSAKNWVGVNKIIYWNRIRASAIITTTFKMHIVRNLCSSASGSYTADEVLKSGTKLIPRNKKCFNLGPTAFTIQFQTISWQLSTPARLSDLYDP